MFDDNAPLRRSSQDILPNPWVRPHRLAPSDLAVLEAPIALCRRLREWHTARVGAGRVMAINATDPTDYQRWRECLNELRRPDGAAWDPEPVASLLQVHLNLYAGVCVNQLAAAAAVVEAGEYLYALWPLGRAVAEHAAAATWLLSEGSTPRSLAARTLLDRLVSLSREIDAEHDQERRRARKKFRKDFIAELRSLYYAADQVSLGNQGGGPDSTIDGERYLGLEARLEDLGRRMGDSSHMRQTYAALSMFTHPTPSALLRLFTSDPEMSYFVDIPGLSKLLEVGVSICSKAPGHRRRPRRRLATTCDMMG